MLKRPEDRRQDNVSNQNDSDRADEQNDNCSGFQRLPNRGYRGSSFNGACVDGWAQALWLTHQYVVAFAYTRRRPDAGRCAGDSGL